MEIVARGGETHRSFLVGTMAGDFCSKEDLVEEVVVRLVSVVTVASLRAVVMDGVGARSSTDVGVFLHVETSCGLGPMEQLLPTLSSHQCSTSAPAQCAVPSSVYVVPTTRLALEPPHRVASSSTLRCVGELADLDPR